MRFFFCWRRFLHITKVIYSISWIIRTFIAVPLWYYWCEERWDAPWRALNIVIICLYNRVVAANPWILLAYNTCFMYSMNGRKKQATNMQADYAWNRWICEEAMSDFYSSTQRLCVFLSKAGRNLCLLDRIEVYLFLIVLKGCALSCYWPVTSEGPRQI